MAGCGDGVGTNELRVRERQPDHRRDGHPRWRRRSALYDGHVIILRRRRRRRGGPAAGGKPGREAPDGPGQGADRPGGRRLDRTPGPGAARARLGYLAWRGCWGRSCLGPWLFDWFDGGHAELPGQFPVPALREHQPGDPQDRAGVFTGRPQHVDRLITSCCRSRRAGHGRPARCWSCPGWPAESAAAPPSQPPGCGGCGGCGEPSGLQGCFLPLPPPRGGQHRLGQQGDQDEQAQRDQHGLQPRRHARRSRRRCRGSPGAGDASPAPARGGAALRWCGVRAGGHP